MLITSTETQSERKVLPQGLYAARCCWLIDIGTQPGGGNYPARRQCIMAFELPTEMIEVPIGNKGGKEIKPMVMSRFFTLSLADSSNLRKFLDAWHPSFVAVHPESGETTCDLESVLGKPGYLQVLHKKKEDGKEFNQVGLISAPAKGQPEVPALTSETILWDFDDPKVDQLQKLPEWIRKRVEGCPEFANCKVDMADQGQRSDDLPDFE